MKCRYHGISYAPLHLDPGFLAPTLSNFDRILALRGDVSISVVSCRSEGDVCGDTLKQIKYEGGIWRRLRMKRRVATAAAVRGLGKTPYKKPTLNISDFVTDRRSDASLLLSLDFVFVLQGRGIGETWFAAERRPEGLRGMLSLGNNEPSLPLVNKPAFICRL